MLSFASTKILVLLGFKMSLASCEGKTEKVQSGLSVFDPVFF